MRLRSGANKTLAEIQSRAPDPGKLAGATPSGQPKTQLALDFGAVPTPPAPPTSVSPNTGGPLCATEALRVMSGRSARIVGRVLVTNGEHFACKPCCDKFLGEPFDEKVRAGREPGTPWPIGPMRYRVVWEPKPGKGKGYKCCWCDRRAEGEE